MRTLTLSLLVAAAGCGKTSDIPAMQAEIVGIASSYNGKLADLEKRGDTLAKRLNEIPKEVPSHADASSRFAAAASRFRDLRDQVHKLPGELAKSTTPASLQLLATRIVTKRQGLEQPRPGPYKVELQRVMDAASRKFRTEYLEIVSDLAAVDGWLANADAAVVVAPGETARTVVLPPPEPAPLPPAAVVSPEPAAPAAPAAPPAPIAPGSAPPQ